MKEKDLFKKISKESEQGIPNVYDKILSAARAEGLFNNGGNTEAYSNGSTVALGGVNKKAVAITTLAAFAAISLAIALPIALSGEYDGGIGGPGGIGGTTIASDKPLGEDYAVGAVATAKLVESFWGEETGEVNYAPRTVKAASLVVNPDEGGIERYVSEFENYFYACNSFFGAKPAEVEVVENHDTKYDNSIVITGKFSNGDEARYAMYYSEARIIDDTTVTGDEVKYYLDGVLYLNGKQYSMYGERVYADSTKDKEKSLWFKAYPEFKSDNDCVEMSVEYGADGSVKNYAFTVVKEGKTLSESVLTFPDVADGDTAYNIEFSGDDGDKGGKFTVNRPQQGWESLIVGYEIGNLTSEFRVKATKSKLERVLAPDGLVYDDLGNGTYAITGYDKRKTMPAELFIPDEFEGKKVVKIGESAFWECKDIKKVIIPEGITVIDTFAFYNCTNINEIFLPKTLTQIGTCAFSYIAVAEINLPENLVTLGRQAFSHCNNLESVVIPEKVETLGDQLFNSCVNLKTVNIPASVTEIGDGIISGTALENITVDGSNQYYYVDGGCLMEKATKTVLGGSVGLVIPSDAKIIGAQAFEYSMHLTELTLPASVTEICSLAFENSSIRNIALLGVEKIGYGAFYQSDVTTVEFSENLTTIDDNVFTGCEKLMALNFPASLTSIARSAFGGCYNLESITVAEGNPLYHSAGNCLITNLTKDLVLGCYNSIIPDDGSVETIGGSAFSGQVQLTEITLPESILNIENGAFACSGLAYVVIPSKVTRIGPFAFEKCYGLSNVTLSGSLTSIGYGAFQDCASLRRVTIPEEVENLIIESYAFYNCSSLVEIVLPNGVMSMADAIFKDCRSLEKVTLPSTMIPTIGEQFFYGCNCLTQIIFDGTKKEWIDIEKDEGWDWDTGDYVVICSDGTLAKDGYVIS